MADVNDTNGLRRRLQNVIDKIDTADVSAADRAALKDYAQWKRRRASSLNTARIYIRGVTLSAERYDGSITTVDNALTVEDIISAHEAAGCKASKSINSKLDGLRDFWRWCESTDHGVDEYRWVDLVKNVEASDENPGTDPLDPDLILSESEITALVRGVDSYRDKALIEFLADTGARITLTTQMKRGDIDVETVPPTFRPNPQGIAHKDVATKDFVLKESTDALRRYLDEAHPDEHADAPLFALHRGYDPEERSAGAISRRRAFDVLTDAATDAGIDPERAHPHNIRKSAVVRMRLKHDMSWDAIQKRMEWSDQSLPRMKAIYRRIDNSDEVEMVADELGYGEEASVEELDAEVGQALRVLAGKDKETVLAWLNQAE